jgi:hypothetical protein
MSAAHSHIDEPLEQALSGLRRVPERDPQLAGRSRAAYLAEVKGLSKEPYNRMAVSIIPFKRLNDWINSIPILIPRKDRSPMFTVFSTIMVVAALMLGGAGATVYASQGSLPDQPLYQVKTISEEFRLGVTGDPQQQIQLNLSFANRRMQELAAMQQKGQAAPEELATRLQLELNQALQISAGMEDAPMQQALLQIRSAIRQMEQVAGQFGEPAALGEGVLAQVRNVLRSQNRLCELGLQEPAQLRLMFQNRNGQNEEAPGAPPVEPPAGENQGSGAGSGDCPECTPVEDGTGPGPGPNAGAGEGNGSGECTDCTPVQDGTGPGPGPNNGPGAQGGSEVTPGSGACTNCTPAQDGTGPGPGPNNGSGSGSDTGSGGSGGSGSDTGSGGSNSGGSSSGGETTPGGGSGGSGQGGSGKP